MKNLEMNQMICLQGGNRSEGAGKVCGFGVTATAVLVGSGAGVALGVAVGAVTAGMCGLSIFAAWDE